MSVVFYYGEDEAKRQALNRQALAVWGKTHEVRRGKFLMLQPERNRSVYGVEEPEMAGCIAGYVRWRQGGAVSTQRPASFGDHNKFLCDEIRRGHWPVSDDLTGLFSAVTYDGTGDVLSLCNDVTGFYPMYYSIASSEVMGGTSLLILARANRRDPDLLGLLESIAGIECTFGTRTLISGVHRLLPGELLVIRDGKILRQSFDDTLYTEIDGRPLARTAEEVWELMKEDVRACVGDEPRVILGLSGGWDSRLVLGALKEAHLQIDCYTVGDEGEYETRVARRLAALCAQKFRSFPVYEDYFPRRESLKDAVRLTEQVHVSSWFAVTNHLPPEDVDRVFLLGEAFEAVDGRNIAQLQTREARIRNYAREQILRKETPLEKSTPASLQAWMQNKEKMLTHYLLRNYRQCVSDEVLHQLDERRIVEEFHSDLQISFERIRQVFPPFTPLFDELFAWFYKSRGLTQRQQIQLDEKFVSIGPTSTTRLLRRLSNVHPRNRLNRNLMDQLARIPELSELARVPSAQIPFVGALWPKTVRNLIWGARSKADLLLIRRMMKTKNRKGRQRVLPSTDFAGIYSDTHNRETLRSWFSGRWIRPEYYVDIFDARASLRVWPLENIHMLSVASKSLMLDMCTADHPFA